MGLGMLPRAQRLEPPSARHILLPELPPQRPLPHCTLTVQTDVRDPQWALSIHCPPPHVTVGWLLHPSHGHVLPPRAALTPPEPRMGPDRPGTSAGLCRARARREEGRLTGPGVVLGAEQVQRAPGGLVDNSPHPTAKQNSYWVSTASDRASGEQWAPGTPDTRSPGTPQANVVVEDLCGDFWLCNSDSTTDS